ncbi:DUF411 domain-containing protein [Parasedimentitalea huanghaiensis]|uniref:DUF411 domain-containing protein n=1 Tax=Parasedimentitalea huanghaiensis TaxID=2682100 RepID=A0A6L6WKC7_9RHOB|nr:DUF411 domain-containing protein [Zongyanglinia huanghaiensis]MVO17608.1 DUF411 domain-containing protein [Zongyanglinia huanghaiensis]
MNTSAFTRRNLLQGMLAVAAVSAAPAIAQGTPKMQVLKDPSCGCCGSWVKIMKRSGFDVSVQETTNEKLFRHKLKSGITEELASCHTASIEGYLIEGHVPPSDVKRLLAERPDALGLSVPGMPWGSPGMGPESERDAYDVILFYKDGTTEVFARYEAA